MRKYPPKMIDADHIKEQAKLIRDIAQAVVDACVSEQPIDPYARNKIAGGHLAQDAAVLGIMLVQYEMEHEKEKRNEQSRTLNQAL